MRMRIRTLQIAILVFAFGVSLPVSASDRVAGWRGDGTGSFSSTEPPIEWSLEENVVWKTPMPDWSNSQPVLAGDRLFVCAEPNLLVCVRISDGGILWQRTNRYEDVAGPEEWARARTELEQDAGLVRRQDAVAKQMERLQKQLEAAGGDSGVAANVAALEKELEMLQKQREALPLAQKYQTLTTHETLNGYTTATPTTNGEHVWAVFGNAVVACYDREGARKWIKKLPDLPQAMWGHSASPLLIDDRLIVTIDDTVALDAKTGKELWRTNYGRSWGSAVRARIGGTDVIVLANGRFVRADDGKILGRGPILANGSPIVHGAMVYYIQEAGGAVKLPAEVGNAFDPEIVWETRPKGRTHYASPVLHDGLIYTVSSSGIFSVIDALNGGVVHQRRMDLGPGTFYPSTASAGDFVYVSSDNGTTVVLEAGREPREISRNQLERFMSTPVFSGTRMYLRTHDSLFCIGSGNR